MAINDYINRLPSESSHYYRTFGNESNLGMIGCGFMYKTISKETCWDYKHFVVVWVLRGRGRFIDHNGTSHCLSPGSAFLRLPEKPHTIVIEEGPWLEAFLALKYCPFCADEDISKWVNFFSDDWIHEINRIPGDTVATLRKIGLIDRQILHPGLSLNLLKQIHTIYGKMRDSSLRNVKALHFDLLSVINQINQYAIDPGDRYDEEITQRACELIQDHLSSRDAMEDYLQATGLSYSRTRAIFKRVMGVTPGNYLIQLRLDNAISLLRKGHSVAEVADKLGYSSPHAFSAQFKKFTGRPPSSV